MSQLPKVFLFLGSLNMMLAVMFGAFGAHGLRGRISTEMMAVYHTGNQYHFYNALGLLGVGLLALHLPGSTLLKWCGWLMFGGIVLFSGSLYALAISGVRGLGAITPIGGVAFIVAWLVLAIAIWRAA